jgi:hypothetical protein
MEVNEPNYCTPMHGEGVREHAWYFRQVLSRCRKALFRCSNAELRFERRAHEAFDPTRNEAQALHEK